VFAVSLVSGFDTQRQADSVRIVEKQNQFAFLSHRIWTYTLFYYFFFLSSKDSDGATTVVCDFLELGFYFCCLDNFTGTKNGTSNIYIFFFRIRLD
jgi:hypothetical protein